MTYKNNVVVELAQAIINIQSAADDHVDATLEKLWLELDHLSKNRTVALKEFPKGTESEAPVFIDASAYIDFDSVVHHVPDGHRLRWALVTNKLWPSGFSQDGQPVYGSVQNQSGSEYVDMWLEFTGSEYSRTLAAQGTRLRKFIAEGHTLKTSNQFCEGTPKPVELMRLMITHREFCERQGIDRDAC